MSKKQDRKPGPRPRIQLTGRAKDSAPERKKEVFPNSWQWMLYLYVFVPAMLYGLAYFSGAGFLGRMYHTYNLYIINPVPNFENYTGLAGFFIAMYLLFRPLQRRKWLDFGLSAVLTALIVSFFQWDVHYWLLSHLKVL
jgi:hypothetical protein